MGKFRDFFKAVKNTGPLMVGMLRVNYNRRTMTPGEKHAYDAISKTVCQDNATNEIRVSVPAGISQKDASKALHTLQLEYGKDWKVVFKASDNNPPPPAPPKP